MQALEPGDPRKIGPYRILARLGAGGMATVYFGRSPGLRAAAVKQMHAELAAEQSHRERFRQEVRATGLAGGPFCPSVLGAGPDAELPWLATEFLPSVSLRDAVSKHGGLPIAALPMLAAGLVEALASVHRAGIAHLDLKPANVLLTHDGPRLIDFGIAAELGVVPPDRSGSKGYMAPERLAGVAADAASDVFALGATLAYACSGCPAELQGVIKDCMRPDASTRPTLAELTDRLAAIAPDNPLWLPTPVQAQIDRLAAEAANPPQAAPIPADPRRLLLWSAGALAVLVLGGLAIGLRPPNPASPADAAPTRTPASNAANPPPSKPALRTVEFYAYGRTTVKVLTTTINGHALTVHDVRLPYRRTLQLAPWQGPGSWSIEYTTSAGQFRCVMLVDGKPAANANGSSTGGDMHYEEHGEFTL